MLIYANLLTISINLFCCCEKVYPKITHMNTWTVGKNSLPQKKGFYSHLNIEDITNANFKHAKRVRKDFEIKHLGEYHGLHVQSNTLLLAD